MYGENIWHFYASFMTYTSLILLARWQIFFNPLCFAFELLLFFFLYLLFAILLKLPVCCYDENTRWKTAWCDYWFLSNNALKKLFLSPQSCQARPYSPFFPFKRFNNSFNKKYTYGFDPIKKIYPWIWNVQRLMLEKVSLNIINGLPSESFLLPGKKAPLESLVILVQDSWAVPPKCHQILLLPWLPSIPTL